ncbi:uncharacterized protein LOC106077240 isoform X2 [Biomphalaria glabrata]|uniref:Uncharacterized protein LOC106077240 isoform X2 n=1 Tax=Biomphalaria glabrata TaxID=6526 RepID=A0A9W2ZQ04_BIOGL|nr:uncharacterized protein LOC106077240 isoform X2 [Biomphalaria glabrata]
MKPTLSMLGTGLIFVVLIGACSAAYQGCFLESVRRRHFSVSPGDYSPEMTTTISCKKNCGDFNYKYAAVTSGKFCYCANTLPVSSPADDINCNLPCVGAANQMCGGAGHVSVYDATKKISGLSVSTDASNKVIPVATTVNIGLSVSDGPEAVYALDYDDGSGRTALNTTNMLTTVYYIPGEYSIKAFGSDVNQSLQEAMAATTVRVDAPPGESNVTCDTLFATFEIGMCTFTIWSGTSLQVNLSVSSVVYSISIEDPPLSLAGPAFQSLKVTSGDTNPAVYLLYANEFTVSGRILGYEMFVDSLGSSTISLLIMKPGCSSGSYCYSRNICTSGTCESSTSRATSCPAAEQFCGQSSKCYSSCSAAASRYSNKPDIYVVVSTLTVSVSTTGFVYVTENNFIKVEPGYVIGLVHTSGATVLGRTTGTSDTYDLQFVSNTLTVGSTLTISSGTNTFIRHAFIAVASAGSKVSLPFRFETPGQFVLNVDIGSQTLGSQYRSNTSTSVLVLEGVNATIISGPQFVKTGVAVTYLIEPHSGSDVYYNWTFSDNTTFLVSRNRTVSRSFNVRGEYEVMVTTYNGVSNKTNSSYTYVQDEITGLTVSSNATVRGLNTSITVSLTSGSNYTCLYNYGDGSSQLRTGLMDRPITNVTYVYTYATPGNYIVNITCVNDVSSTWRTVDVQVQDQITNLILLTMGANVNTPFNIEWTMDAGTSVTFTLTFNGQPISFSPVSPTRWRSVQLSGRSASVLPLRLTASNLVSYYYMDSNFTILTAIVSPTLTTTAVNATSHEPIEFTVNMAAGSDVNVTMDYGDGSYESFVAPVGSDWTKPYVFTHIFTSGGRFTITANFKNAGGSINRSLQILILVGVGIIDCDLPDYALYHPPAYVNLTLSAPVMPTEPSLTLNWGERTSRDILYSPLLTPNITFPYEFRDTGTFIVKAELKNLMGTKLCWKNITVVEKLSGPSFILPFNKAAVNLPFVVNFCLFRGPSEDLCNLTFDFGNGARPLTLPRKGQGKDGCDTQNVTYTSKTSYNLTVTANTPLENVTSSVNVIVINGIRDIDIDATTNGDVTFGTNTTLTVTFTGKVLPDDASISIDYGDGTPQETYSFIPKLVVSRPYAKDGLFRTNISVYNDATMVNKTVQVGVYQNFQNLRPLVFYLADKPPNATLYGFNNLSQLYPHNKDLYFRLVDDNNAYASFYNLTVSDSTGTNLTATYNTSVFSYNFPASGQYTVYITAWNPLFSADIVPKQLKFFEMIQGFVFDENSTQSTKIDEAKLFNVSFGNVGTDTCLYLDFGDGVKETYASDVTKCTYSPFQKVTPKKQDLSSFKVNHTYTEEKYFEVTAIAMNDQTTEKRVVGFSINGLGCSKPSVNIDKRRIYFTSPESYRRSDRIKIRGLSNILCVTTYDNVKSWNLFKIDKDYDNVTGNVSLAGLETSKAELNIPARFLELGLYRAHYTMTMAGAVGSALISSTTFTYFEVIKSDLIGIMIEGGASEIQRGTLQNLLLQPTLFSRDPDVDVTEKQNIIATSWTCEIAGKSVSTGCLESGFNSSAQSQLLTLAKMNLTTYRFTVTLSKDTRTTSAELKVTVVNGSPPTASIAPAVGSVYYQIADGYKVLKSSRVALDCVCDNCNENDASFEWAIYLSDYRWSNGWRPLRTDELQGLLSGQKSKQIAIESELFRTFDASKMRAECTITQGTMTGRVATNLMINRPPSNGNCSITPYNRTITRDNAWTLTLSDWEDDDGIQEYQFFIHTTDDFVDKQITSFKISDGSFSRNVSLSQGPDFLNYKQSIIVKVRDNLGATTTWSCGEVVVTPLPLETIRAMTKDIKNNQLSSVMKMFAEGDQKTCSEQATSLVSLLNSDSKQSRKEYAGMNVASNFAGSMYGEADADRPSYMTTNSSAYQDYLEYKKESERDERAFLRKELINQMKNLATQSVIAITQVWSFYAEATLYGDEIDQTSQKTVMSAIENMTDFMLDPANIDKVPSEDIEEAISNGVATIGGVLDAAGHNGNFGTLSELEEATKDNDWKDYDTSVDSIGSENDLSTADSFEDAMKIHTASIHKKRQSVTAKKVRDQAMATLDKQTQCFSRYSVPGQSFEIKSAKMKVRLEKTSAETMQNKTLTTADSTAGVSLPATSFLDNANETILVSVSQSTNYPIRYSEAGESISSTTNFVTFNIYNGNSSKMSVSNLTEPIKVTLPHDSKMAVPQYLTVKPMIPAWTTLMNLDIQINRSYSSLHLDFDGIKDRQFLLVVKKGNLSSIGNETEADMCDFVYLMPQNLSLEETNADKYRLQISDLDIGNFTGHLYVGIRELNVTEFNMDISSGCASLPRYENGSDYFRGEFKLRQYVTQCLAISDDASDWSTEGCWVGKETNVIQTVCYCTHLTTFAGGWVVVPNTIDWDYVFSHADFLSNPTIYITVIITAVIYIVAAVWARRRDRKIVEELGLAPLADNDLRDKYFYEIMVSTGMRRNAGTDSQVCFILSGEDDETDVRAFTDSKRKIFRRGQIDGFLMAVPRPLGFINFMRIWHDNSGRGKFASWYLNYVIIRDVQTDVKQVFIANRWFAVEEDDGQIDRVIPVAGREQMADFGYQFGERTRKNLVDGHLWFSVVARPPQSRFTCLQRVSCCLCLLYVSMLANAMFYNTTSNKETATNSFSFGPFSVSPEQIYIGVVCNLIVFPVNVLLIYMFRKSRPHHKRPSRIDLAIKEVTEQSKHASINDVKPEVSSIFSVSKTPTIPKDPYRPSTADTRPATGMSFGSTNSLTPKFKKKKFEFPWYFQIIAWILLWIVTLGSVCMVIFYGISFKDDTCRKWITSLLISFFTSVFITQPLKVFLFAMVLSLIFKNPTDDEEDEEEDEELPQVDTESELLHNDVLAAAKPKKIGYKPPDPIVIEKLRAQRMKEIQMWAVIREVIMYSFFLWILMLISYRQLGAGNFLYKDTMKRIFIDTLDTDINFLTLNNRDDFWTWANSGLLSGLRAGPYYNDYPPLKLRAYINDKVSRILGYATMRQLRVKPDQCKVPEPFESVIPGCNIMYNMLTQEERDFNVGWQPIGNSNASDATRSEYTYSSADKLNGYPYWGVLSLYSGGGYVVPLEGSKDDLRLLFAKLQSEQWIDRYTRAVFIEFTTYNPQVNLFSVNTILAEFDQTGGLVPSYRFEPAMLLPYMTSAMLFQLVCEAVYMLFTLFFIVRELRNLFKAKMAYFLSFWNLVELGIIAMSLAAIVIYFYRLIMTNGLTEQFKETKGNGYVKFQYVGYWNEMFSYMIGFLIFLATLKFLKLLRFNKKISMLSATLENSARSLLHFGLIFTIVFMAFSQLFYVTYMCIEVNYASFLSTLISGVLMMMGNFDIHTMVMQVPILTQIIVLAYVITVSFIIINMFVSILNETFAAVREDVKKQGNDYEIVDFMLQRFKKWTGLGGSESEESPANDPLGIPDNPKAIKMDGTYSEDNIDNFPDRIEKLLKTISSVYNDNDNFGMFYQKQPYTAPKDRPTTNNPLAVRSNRSISPAPGYPRRKASVVARVHTD